MEGHNIDWKNLPPKSKVIVSYMRELGEKLEKFSKGLDSTQKDTQIVNAKRNSSDSGRSSQSSKSEKCEKHEKKRSRREERRERCERKEEEPREEELNIGKVVRLVTLEFGHYALVWYTIFGGYEEMWS
ncbi:hypothetical protein CR513_03220, partial [Mucuna pruriens]